jgi:hypothetical protein
MDMQAYAQWMNLQQQPHPPQTTESSNSSTSHQVTTNAWNSGVHDPNSTSVGPQHTTPSHQPSELDLNFGDMTAGESSFRVLCTAAFISPLAHGIETNSSLSPFAGKWHSALPLCLFLAASIDTLHLSLCRLVMVPSSCHQLSPDPSVSVFYIAGCGDSDWIVATPVCQ